MNKKSKLEVLGIIFIILFSVFLYLTNRNDKTLLEKSGVYVVGKLFSSSSKGEISWVYDYQYKFGDKIYHKSFTGPLPSENKNDSLMFFKILVQDPEVCQQLPKIKVPKCITFLSMPPKGWQNLPLKTCD